MYSTEKVPLCCTICLSIATTLCFVSLPHVLVSPQHRSHRVYLHVLVQHLWQQRAADRRGVEAVLSHSASYSLSKCKEEKTQTIKTTKQKL